MPKSEYMNAAQLKFFRERLLELQTQMRDNAGATTEHLRELSFAPDPADRATLEEEHALELRTRDRERKLLKKIDQALARIDDGSYGYCEETGEPIGLQRLHRAPDGHAHHRGAGAPRDEAEALRRVTPGADYTEKGAARRLFCWEFPLPIMVH